MGVSRCVCLCFVGKRESMGRVNRFARLSVSCPRTTFYYYRYYYCCASFYSVYDKLSKE